MSKTFFQLVCAICVAAFAHRGIEAAPKETELEKRFNGKVKPFMEAYCVECHDSETKKAEFDITPYTNMVSVARDFGHWELVMERLQAAEMPPQKSKQQPKADQRNEVIAWIQQFREFEAKKSAG